MAGCESTFPELRARRRRASAQKLRRETRTRVGGRFSCASSSTLVRRPTSDCELAAGLKGLARARDVSELAPRAFAESRGEVGYSTSSMESGFEGATVDEGGRGRIGLYHSNQRSEAGKDVRGGKEGSSLGQLRLGVALDGPAGNDRIHLHTTDRRSV